MAEGPEAKRPPHIWLLDPLLFMYVSPHRKDEKMVERIFPCVKIIRKFRLNIAIASISILCIYAIIIGSDNQVHYFPSLISKASAQAAEHCEAAPEKIDALKQSANGFFKNMRFTDISYDMRELSFKDESGKSHTLGEFTGKTLLVNIWASWCVPCRTEMPELANLKRNMANSNFDVIAINIDKTAPDEKVRAFLSSIKADNIVFYRDQSMEVFNNARKQGLALGLPITMLVDKGGCLTASYNGSAPWSNVDAETLMKAAIKADSQ